MNLTLSVEERLIKRARHAADAMGKSLNQLIREYLEQLTATDDAQRDLDELRRLTAEGRGAARGWQFDRDELHGRS